MEKETFDFIAKRTEILANADTSTQVTKDAANAWLEAVKADESKADEATETLCKILEGRPTTIDGLMGFLKTAAIDMMGEEAAKKALEAQEQRKSEGAKWCNCPACTAATEILAKMGYIEL